MLVASRRICFCLYSRRCNRNRRGIRDRDSGGHLRWGSVCSSIGGSLGVLCPCNSPPVLAPERKTVRMGFKTDIKVERKLKMVEKSLFLSPKTFGVVTPRQK